MVDMLSGIRTSLKLCDVTGLNFTRAKACDIFLPKTDIADLFSEAAREARAAFEEPENAAKMAQLRRECMPKFSRLVVPSNARVHVEFYAQQ